MSIVQFERFLGKSKREFKEFLRESVELNKEMRKLLGRMANKCTSSFEEEMLGEGLREVFNEHMMELANQGA